MSGGEGKGENKAPSAVNVPNALTVLRLVLVPVFLWLLLENTTGSRWWALAVFAIAAYTDHLDGEIARKHNIITNFGKLADPLASSRGTAQGAARPNAAPAATGPLAVDRGEDPDTLDPRIARASSMVAPG